MLLNKRRLTYQDFLNNAQTKPMQKPETKPKIQSSLKNIHTYREIKQWKHDKMQQEFISTETEKPMQQPEIMPTISTPIDKSNNEKILKPIKTNFISSCLATVAMFVASLTFIYSANWGFFSHVSIFVRPTVCTTKDGLMSLKDLNKLSTDSKFKKTLQTPFINTFLSCKPKTTLSAFLTAKA